MTLFRQFTEEEEKEIRANPDNLFRNHNGLDVLLSEEEAAQVRAEWKAADEAAKKEEQERAALRAEGADK